MYSVGSGKWYLYFGCRNSDVDNIYGDELIKAKNNGTFTDVYIALSREQGTPKVSIYHYNITKSLTD